MLRKMTKVVLTSWALLVVLPATAPAGLTNGNFDSYSGGYTNPSTGVFTLSQLKDGGANGYTGLTGWSVGSGTYGFLMAAGKGDTTGAYSPQFGNTFSLWGSQKGAYNPLPTTSPSGGNYVVLDADAGYHGTGISQTLTGLTAGLRYAVTFSWATAQQYGYSGGDSEALQVGFGNQTQTTSYITTPSQGSTPWIEQTFTFTADGTSDTLNFLAMSMPNGAPPMVLLDNVSFAAVPEPASLALVGLGLGAVTVVRRLRRAPNPSA